MNERRNRRWTEAETNYLLEEWGHTTIDGLCKKLGRTKSAILNKTNKLGMAPYLESGEYITLHQLSLALGVKSYKYLKVSWGEKRGLPIHNKKRGSCTYRVIYLDEFWKWAEKNRSFINFGKLEPLTLGEEPDWVAEQRRKDFYAPELQRKDVWTSEEDSKLIALLRVHQYGYAELAEMLHRSAGAIQRRCTDLGIKERPVKADNHGKSSIWTESHFAILEDGIKKGDSYMLIGQKIGKSEKAVRGKAYLTYFTEDADKIRAMMGKEKWGFGAPTPTVKQGIYVSKTRTEIKKNLSILDAVLRKRMNDLGFEPYWQRLMCVNWDDIVGCSAGCADCDSCAEFQRIRPQYCARCGKTFYEKTENRFCKSCRTARKKNAQRHWSRVNKGK